MDSSGNTQTPNTPAGDVRFAGVELTIGDRTFVCPPIALKKMRELQPRLGSLDFSNALMPPPEAMELITDMTLAALNRNYPALTRDELEELLDLGNIAEVIEVVTSQAGLVKALGKQRAGSP